MDSSFGKGPFEVRVSDFRVTDAENFTIGAMGTLNQPCITDKVSYGIKAVGVEHFIEDSERGDIADAADGSKQAEIVGVDLAGVGTDLFFELVDDAIVRLDKSKIGVCGGMDVVGEPEMIENCGMITDVSHLCRHRWPVILGIHQFNVSLKR